MADVEQVIETVEGLMGNLRDRIATVRAQTQEFVGFDAMDCRHGQDYRLCAECQEARYPSSYGTREC